MYLWMPYLLLLALGGTLLLVFGVLVIWEYLTDWSLLKCSLKHFMNGSSCLVTKVFAGLLGFTPLSFIAISLVENSSSLFISISCSQGILNSSRLSCFLLPKIACLHVSFTAYENFYKLSKMHCPFVLIFHFPFFRISECRNPTIKHISNYTCP